MMPDTNQDGAAGTPATSSQTSSFTTTIDLEAQVLRDGLPLTRPTRWAPGLDVSFLTTPDGVATWKLFPGSSSKGEETTVTVYNAGEITDHWVGIYAVVNIDGIPVTSSRPGQLFIPSDLWPWDGGPWSCIMHLPLISHLAYFRGTHTLLLRAIAR